MLVVDKRPDLFEAYLGLSQISDWSESDQRAYQWAVERAAAVGDQDALRELQDLAPYDSNDFEKKGVLLSYVTNYGAGALRDMDRAFELVIKPLASVREFTLSAKIGFFPTMVETTEAMLPELLTINLFDRIPQVEIPVYFIHGIHDQQVSYSLSKEYFEQLRAPEKKFFTFEHSAHGLIPEEPDRYTQILIEEFLKLKAPRTREVEVEPEGSIPHPIRP